MHFVMKFVVFATLAAAGATAVTAESKSPKLPRCDGKSRRPANVYGTILPSVDPAAGTVTSSPPPSKAVDVFPPMDMPRGPAAPSASPSSGDGASTPVPQIGAVEQPQIFRSC